MINTRGYVVFIILAMLFMPLVHAQDLSGYRGFQLGMSLPAAAKQAGIDPSEAKVIYQRTPVIQELDGKTRSIRSISSVSPTDLPLECSFSPNG
ncbi:MAG TPA: hypothetical protein VMG30_06035 [Acidobacteriota bacterium]|nr:hypothetical protein [Acidobacteriota bacterium]